MKSFICSSVTLNSCLQSRCWLQDHQPSQNLQKARTMRAPPNIWSVCVMALAPFPPLCQLATSLPCCCCYWMPDRLEDMFIQWDKEHSSRDPVHYRLALTALLPLDPPEGLLCVRPCLLLWGEGCFERAGFDCTHRKWGQLLATHVFVFFILSDEWKTAGIQCRGQMDSVNIIERFIPVNTN